jgi:hypothetical protein
MQILPLDGQILVSNALAERAFGLVALGGVQDRASADNHRGLLSSNRWQNEWWCHRSEAAEDDQTNVCSHALDHQHR